MMDISLVIKVVVIADFKDECKDTLFYFDLKSSDVCDRIAIIFIFHDSLEISRLILWN